MFNGRMDNDGVGVNPGDQVRKYFVNIGPSVSLAHVIGTLFDRVDDGKEPIVGVQTYAVPAGSGVMLEFHIPEEGVYPFVDHDSSPFYPTGSVLASPQETFQLWPIDEARRGDDLPYALRGWHYKCDPQSGRVKAL